MVGLMTAAETETAVDSKSETVWVVVEEKGMQKRIQHIFDTRETAYEYLKDPDNAGATFIEEHTVESEYSV